MKSGNNVIYQVTDGKLVLNSKATSGYVRGFTTLTR